MATSVKQMMEAANAAVPRITPAQAREMIAKGNTLVVDVRDASGSGEERQGCGRRARLSRHVGIPRRSRVALP